LLLYNEVPRIDRLRELLDLLGLVGEKRIDSLLGARVDGGGEIVFVENNVAAWFNTRVEEFQTGYI
jgi:hypothetical protein